MMLWNRTEVLSGENLGRRAICSRAMTSSPTQRCPGSPAPTPSFDPAETEDHPSVPIRPRVQTMFALVQRVRFGYDFLGSLRVAPVLAFGCRRPSLGAAAIPEHGRN